MQQFFSPVDLAFGQSLLALLNWSHSVVVHYADYALNVFTHLLISTVSGYLYCYYNYFGFSLTFVLFCHCLTPG